MSEQQNDASGGDDMSGLTGFFFYMFIVHPITAWILRPGRFERKKSIMYAILFLAGLAAIKTGLEVQQRGPNYYQKLGITRSSSPLEIKRAYKKLSLQLHPDKNPSPDAPAQFDAVKQAYDVLMDMELREVYNKFGHEGIQQNKRYSETQFLMEIAVFYVSYGVMAFLLTMGKKSGEARNWTFTGLLAMLVLEVAVMSSQGNPLPEYLFPTLTECEIVWLLHSLFPAFMNGCRSLGAYLFVDLDAQTRQLLLALQEQNKDILLVLREVQIGVQTIQTHGAGRNSTSGAVVTTDMPRATPTGKIRELQERLQASNSSVAQAVQNLKADKGSSSNLGFYGLILGYIVISYVFNN
ncbi:DnaJ homolog subfamily C member 10 [Fistulifera solaris]|uniref:DnaJ homolog subfamily C member 10 n=1 Tax=Fistulifera solaris TaxID=1519565 RepID=A0A1Z5J629_FISSO|nr:DnaJ homolog subfamily C member 10 [Fistulifera solaris]|eukprot:GAX09457.1 DnaJ homolog subfamily C member 10 [Fistulifera solaris]